MGAGSGSFQVNTGTVSAAGASASQAASTLSAAASALDVPAVSGNGFTTATALTSFCSSWKGALSSMQQACSGVSSDFSGSATAYESTEAHVRQGWA